MTLSIYHTRLEDDSWIATCDMFPAWSYTSPHMDAGGAQTSLKLYISRHVRFTHHGWNGKT